MPPSLAPGLRVSEILNPALRDRRNRRKKPTRLKHLARLLFMQNRRGKFNKKRFAIKRRTVMAQSCRGGVSPSDNLLRRIFLKR
jgi:hypothetical protein